MPPDKRHAGKGHGGKGHGGMSRERAHVPWLHAVMASAACSTCSGAGDMCQAVQPCVYRQAMHVMCGHQEVDRGGGAVLIHGGYVLMWRSADTWRLRADVAQC
jgi:hypothetical protein